jgi:hypothetical protein
MGAHTGLTTPVLEFLPIIPVFRENIMESTILRSTGTYCIIFNRLIREINKDTNIRNCRNCYSLYYDCRRNKPVHRCIHADNLNMDGRHINRYCIQYRRYIPYRRYMCLQVRRYKPNDMNMSLRLNHHPHRGVVLRAA